MKKRWPVWLSICLLVLGFIPNLIQASKAFADSSQEITQQVITNDRLDVRTVVRGSAETIIWDIHYKSKASNESEQQRVKFHLTDSNGQVVRTMQKDGWTFDENDWFVSSFQSLDEGTLSFETEATITSLQLKVQVDSQTIETTEEVLTENSLPDIGSQNYTLYAPEKSKQSDSNDESKQVSEATNDKQITNPTEQPTETTEASTLPKEEAPVETKVVEEKTNESSTAIQADRSTVSNFSSKSIFESIHSLSEGASYPAIQPEYTTDVEGIYPKSSWSPTGNTTVRNHQGKMYGSTSWDGVANWDGNPTNKTNSYIEYGGTGANAEFAIRKYAKETSTPGLYDVYLNVRGNELRDIKPIDIVLVVDMSGSMEPEKASAVRQGVKDFLTYIKDAGIGQYVNVGFVGYSSLNQPTYVGLIKEEINPVSNNNHITNINDKLKKTFIGGTFTQLGIQTGKNMLNSYSSTNQKMMILLTDGVPTYSYKVTKSTLIGGVLYGTEFGTGLDNPGDTSELDYSYVDTTGKRIYDTFAATLGEAKLAKDSGTQLHVLGIKLERDGSYLTQTQVRQRTSLMASTGYYQDANTSDAVKTYLQNQAVNVVSAFNTVNQGNIKDPIGDQFIYNSSVVDLTSVGTSTVTTLPSANIAGNQLNVSNLTLGKNQEVQIHYQVRINTESSSFVPDQWYPMNGRTLFTPNGTNPTNQVDFGVPSAKAAGVKLSIEKRWQEYDNDPSQRPETVDFSITRSVVTTSGAWTKGYVRLSAPTWMNATIAQVASVIGGSQTLWLPKFNNQGVNFTYTIDEATVPDGYEASSNTDGSIWTNTKLFTPLGLVISKISNQNETPLKGAVFKLTGGTLPSAEILLLDQGDGTYILPATFKLQLNSTYTLIEVTPPAGHEATASTWQVKVSETGVVTINNTEDGVIISDHTIHYTIENQFKPIIFRTEKYRRESTDMLSGAKFTLKQYTENWQGNGTVIGALNDLIGNETSSFKSLTPGYYTIQETTTPTGYLEENTPYKFRVTIDGKVYNETDTEIVATNLPSVDGWYWKATNNENVLIFAKYNQLRLFDVSILKEDYHTKEKLVDAQFGLAKKDEPDTIIATLETDENGQGIFKNADGSSEEAFGLESGVYIIKELAAPKGYTLLAEMIELTIETNGEVIVSYQNTDVTQSLADVSLNDEGTNTIRLTLANTKKGELPATGGQGRAMFVIGSGGMFGMMVLLAGYYVFRNRKEERGR